jgi:hypothetical protein
VIAMLASAALIGAASIAVGAAIVTLCGWRGGDERGWSWLGPAVGIAALLVIAAVGARLPGRAATAFALLTIVTFLAIAYLAWHGTGWRVLAAGAPAALLAALGAALPFIVNDRIGILGIGLVNDDMASHLLIADWVQNETDPAPSLVEGGYPLGPHSLVAALAEGIGAVQVDVFAGLTLAIAALVALTALAALAELPQARRTLAAVLTALCYLGAAYLAQGAFKEPLQALILIAFALGLAELARAAPPESGWRGLAVAALPLAVLAAGAIFNYSFPGLFWLIGTAAVVWLLRGAPVGRLRPALPVVGVALAAAAVVTIPEWGRIAEFADFRAFSTSGEQALGNLRHSISPLEVLGIWPSSEFRIAPADARLPAAAFYLGALLGVAALAVGLLRAQREKRPELPAALAAALLIYVGAAAVGTPYTSAKALAIAAPVAILIALQGMMAADWLPRLPAPSRLPRLGLLGLGAAFVAAAALSSFLVLRSGPVSPSVHPRELAKLRPEVQGARVLFLGRDDFIAWHLRGAEVKTHLQNYYDVGQVDARDVGLDKGEEKFDFDAVHSDVLDRFRYVLLSRTAYASEPPRNFRSRARTASFVLWKRVRATPERETLREGPGPVDQLNCRSEEGRDAAAARAATIWRRPPVRGGEGDWNPDATAEPGSPEWQTLTLGRGRWAISLAYDAPRGVELRVSGPGVVGGERTLSVPPNLDFRGPTPTFPVGKIEVDEPGPVRFEAELRQAPLAARLLGYEGAAHLRTLAASPASDVAELTNGARCGEYVDWYRGGSGDGRMHPTRDSPTREQQ